MDVIFSNGYVSDYDDFYLWVEEFKVGAKAAYIAKDEDGEAVSYTPAEVLKLAEEKKKRQALLDEYEAGTKENKKKLIAAKAPYSSICAIDRMIYIIKMEKETLKNM
ncbi:MAG: hypothetical protein IK106_07935 [Clostridiales bacterium]|nr:hypothetical protein [Clostridiales bacterium]